MVKESLSMEARKMSLAGSLSTSSNPFGRLRRENRIRLALLMEISTNQPGIQFYDGHLLDGEVIGRGGRIYRPRAGLCLEPQKFPDAPNHESFPSSRLVPGEVYANRASYKFTTNAS